MNKKEDSKRQDVKKHLEKEQLNQSTINIENTNIMQLNLTQEQKEAIYYNDSPLLILAGVGTGKTQTLMSKYIYLIQKGVLPQNILALTFSKKAAKEMLYRAQILSGSQLQNMTIRTIHSFSAFILKKYEWHKQAMLTENFNIIDEEMQYRIIEQILIDNPQMVNTISFHTNVDLRNQENKVPSFMIKFIIKSLEKFKNIGLTYTNMEYHTQHKFSLLEKYIFENIYSLYQKQLMQQDSCDFNDLIFYVVKLMNLEKEPAPTILIYLYLFQLFVLFYRN